MKSVWEEFFDAHAPIYEENVFTKNTIQEVNFLTEELAVRDGGSILDVGCGTGRHSIELARRGYAVTGLDLSAEMLARAADAARSKKVNVQWIRSDAARFQLPDSYDGAICLCEGAFGLLGKGDDPIGQPLSILCNISRSLKPQAKAVFTVLNALASIRRNANKDVEERRFDPLTLVESSECTPREGVAAVAVRERAFVPTELAYGAGQQGTGGEGPSTWMRWRSWLWHAKQASLWMGMAPARAQNCLQNKSSVRELKCQHSAFR